MGDGREFCPVCIRPEALPIHEYDLDFVDEYGHGRAGGRGYGGYRLGGGDDGGSDGAAAAATAGAAGAVTLTVTHKPSSLQVASRAISVLEGESYVVEPIVLYTQSLTPTVLNIAHMHINDGSVHDCAVAGLNLTGTGRTVHDADVRALPTDATGRALDYKIIVDGGEVLAVLHKCGGEVADAPFVVHKVPAMGTLVQCSDGRRDRRHPSTSNNRNNTSNNRNNTSNGRNNTSSSRHQLGMVRSIPKGMLIPVDGTSDADLDLLVSHLDAHTAQYKLRDGSTADDVDESDGGDWGGSAGAGAGATGGGLCRHRHPGTVPHAPCPIPPPKKKGEGEGEVYSVASVSVSVSASIVAILCFPASFLSVLPPGLLCRINTLVY
jgi:hypothetical protein